MDDKASPSPAHYERWVGYYFIGMGWLSAIGFVMGRLFGLHYELNLAFPLLIWIGLRILQLREGFRRGVCWVTGIASALLITGVLINPFRHRVTGITIMNVYFDQAPGWLAALGCLMVLPLTALPFYWLTRPEVRGRFARQALHPELESASPCLTRRQKVKFFAVLLGVALLLMGIERLTAHFFERVDSSLSISSSQGSWWVNYGYFGNQLNYALFQGITEGPYPRGQYVNVSISTGRRKSARLCLPDGSEQPLPGKVTLMQYLDGKYSERDFKATRAEFEAFMRSHPSRYTIESLVDFINRKQGALPAGAANGTMRP